jgi:hypothetical protein
MLLFLLQKTTPPIFCFILLDGRGPMLRTAETSPLFSLRQWLMIPV